MTTSLTEATKNMAGEKGREDCNVIFSRIHVDPTLFSLSTVQAWNRLRLFTTLLKLINHKIRDPTIVFHEVACRIVFLFLAVNYKYIF